MSNQHSNQKETKPTVRPGMMRGGHGHQAKIEKAKDTQQALARLVSYMRPYRAALVVVFIFVLLYTLFGLAGPYLMGVAIDDFIAGKDLGGLTRTALLMLTVYLFAAVFQAVSGWLMAGVSQKALKQLRRELFEHLQTLSLSFYDRNPAGELMSRLTNDIDAINQTVSQNVTALFASTFTLVGILIAMFALNAWLALAAVLVVPLLVVITGFIARYTRRGFRRLQKNLGQLNSVMEENISGQRMVKAFRRSDSAISAFQEHNHAVYEAGVYANSYALLMMPLSQVLGNLFVVAIAGTGGFLTIKGMATIGTIAAFIGYSRMFIRPLGQLANIYNSIQAALAGAERIFETIDTQPELTNAPGALSLERISGDVRFENVDFSYTPGVPVITDMTMQAQAGQTIALVGPTGAGKTTLTNLLTRFYDIDSGSITIDGIDIRQVKKADLRSQLALVLQDTFLFSDTVMENIRFGRLDATDEECIQAAQLADADHFIRQLSNGYQTGLSERGGNLSQGQRQLLTLARAILADPGILILDEATSSVDTRTEARIQNALLRLMEGRTSFVIAHRLSTIREADNVLVIDEGRIVEQGSHQELLDQRGFYHNLYLSQFKGKKI